MPVLTGSLVPAVAPRGESERLAALLSRLYAEQHALTPDDPYMAEHARERVVSGQVVAFDWYRPLLPPTGAVLDWGCNHAPDSCLLRAAAGDRYALHACDYREPGHFAAFHDFAGIAYTRLTHLYQLPYGDAQYDAVVASGVLEHAAWDYESLKELYRVLKPGGVLVVTYLPNRFSVQEWLLRVVRKAGYHRRLYDLSATRRMLLGTGFEVMEARFQATLRGGWSGAALRAIPGLAALSSVLCFVARKRDSM